MARWPAGLLAATMLGAGTAVAAQTGDPVVVGVVYTAPGTPDPRAALDTAADIVNSPHKGLEALPLGAGVGLPGLGGAKIAVRYGDALRNVSVAQSQALRLIGQQHVAALIAAGGAATTYAASAVAGRRGVPFVAASDEPPAGAVRERKWVFRTAPEDADFARLYVRFFGDLRQGGHKLDRVALAFESTDDTIASAGRLRDALNAAGFAAVAEIALPPEASDLTPQVAQLREASPDAVIVAADAGEAAVLLRTMRTLDYKPPLLVADDGGFSDPGLVASTANLAQGLIDRSAWSEGSPDSAAAIVNSLYKSRTGRDLDGRSASIMQAFFILADALDRAGSRDPAAIDTALRATDLKPAQLIVGYDGVRFDDAGRNTLASSYLVQLQGKQYVAVWPDPRVEGKLALPFKGWE
ncbi:MAG: ABC transporter substrate-binding protein [Alphaproteobacteria bacterium]|nr:ABC transporter substrate-binding protein [Alphaproteobacteria bacterium]